MMFCKSWIVFPVSPELVAVPDPPVLVLVTPPVPPAALLMPESLLPPLPAAELAPVLVEAPPKALARAGARAVTMGASWLASLAGRPRSCCSQLLMSAVICEGLPASLLTIVCKSWIVFPVSPELLATPPLTVLTDVPVGELTLVRLDTPAPPDPPPPTPPMAELVPASVDPPPPKTLCRRGARDAKTGAAMAASEALTPTSLCSQFCRSLPSCVLWPESVVRMLCRSA